MKGLRAPIQVSPRGGAVTGEGPAQLTQNIMFGLLPASSLNPWNQQLTPPEDIIFDIADDRSGNLLISHVYSLFRELEQANLAMLAQGPDAVRLNLARSGQGQVEVAIRYVDLEDNASREISVGPGGL